MGLEAVVLKLLSKTPEISFCFRGRVFEYACCFRLTLGERLASSSSSSLSFSSSSLTLFLLIRKTAILFRFCLLPGTRLGSSSLKNPRARNEACSPLTHPITYGTSSLGGEGGREGLRSEGKIKPSTHLLVSTGGKHNFRLPCPGKTCA